MSDEQELNHPFDIQGNEKKTEKERQKGRNLQNFLKHMSIPSRVSTIKKRIQS